LVLRVVARNDPTIKDLRLLRIRIATPAVYVDPETGELSALNSSQLALIALSDSQPVLADTEILYSVLI
jgi:hypothetical protein